MVWRRKEFTHPLHLSQGTKIKYVKGTCTYTYLLGIWQFLRLGDWLAREKIQWVSILGEPTVWSVIRRCFKEEINHIFNTTHIIMVVYMEIAMSPSLGFLSGSSSPSPSQGEVSLCPQLHLPMCSQPVHKRTLWFSVVAFKDFLSQCGGSKEQEHACRITIPAHWLPVTPVIFSCRGDKCLSVWPHSFPCKAKFKDDATVGNV